MQKILRFFPGLVGAAIAPDYDVSRGLAVCRNGIVNIYSRGDWWMLGVGTKTFGTIDRKRTASAGYVGLQGANGALLTCPGVQQVAWQPSWFWLGHHGGHSGWLAGTWAREVLAPLIDPSVAVR